MSDLKDKFNADKDYYAFLFKMSLSHATHLVHERLSRAGLVMCWCHGFALILYLAAASNNSDLREPLFEFNISLTLLTATTFLMTSALNAFFNIWAYQQDAKEQQDERQDKNDR